MSANGSDPQHCFWCGPDGPCDGSCEVIDLDVDDGDTEDACLCCGEPTRPDAVYCAACRDGDCASCGFGDDDDELETGEEADDDDAATS